MVQIGLVLIADKGRRQQTLNAEWVVRPPGYNWAANAAVAVGMTIHPSERTLSHIALMRNVLPRPALPSMKARSDSCLSTEDII